MNNPLETIQNVKTIFQEYLNKGNLLSWSDLQALVKSEDSPEVIPILNKWYKDIVHLDFLRLITYEYEEIFFNSSLEVLIKTRDSKTELNINFTQEDLEAMFDCMALKAKQKFNQQNPYSSFKAIYNEVVFRITLINKSIIGCGHSKCFVRRKTKSKLSISNYHFNDKVTDIIRLKSNVIIAGATGSGKTTLINTMLQSIPNQEHIVTLEDTEEIILSRENKTNLLSNDQFSLNDLLSYTLRISPDRIVLGEMRSHEVTTFIQAMNTGHKGMMTTLHANSSVDAIHRVALLFQIYASSQISYEQTLKLVTQAIDFVIYIDNKEIASIDKIFGCENSNVYYECVT